jgi:aminopeptidase N
VDDRIVDHEIEVTQVEEDFYVPLGAKPTIVRFDPEYTVLAKVSFDKSNDLLKAQISNPDDMMGRLLACVALGDRKTHESAELLTERLHNDPFFGVRIAAAKSLAKHESDESLKVLRENWKTQDDARVRLAVVQRMLGPFSPETMELAGAVLKDEANPAIQAVAIGALGRFHGEESKQQLVRFLESESFRNELAAAAISAIGKLNDSEMTEPLLSALKERQEEFSARSLGRGLTTLARTANSLDDKDDVFEFICSFTDHPKSTVRTSALGALGKLADDRAISVIESFTQSGDQQIADAAKRALDELNASKPVVPSEIAELRKSMVEMKQATEKLKTELKEMKQQASASQKAE